MIRPLKYYRSVKNSNVWFVTCHNAVTIITIEDDGITQKLISKKQAQNIPVIKITEDQCKLQMKQFLSKSQQEAMNDFSNFKW